MLKVFDGSVWQNIGLVDPSSGGSLPYKVYTALLIQSNSEAPTATVLQNTIGTITWAYDDYAYWTGTCTDCFTDNKTYAVMYNSQLTSNGLMIDIINNDTVLISGDADYDVTAYPLEVEIRVYP